MTAAPRRSRPERAWRGYGSQNSTAAATGRGGAHGPRRRPAASARSPAHVAARDRPRAGSSRRWRTRAPPARPCRAARTSTPGRCSRLPATTARARRRDPAPRPPADRSPEPCQPLRQHRDRGGALLHVQALSDSERGRDRPPGSRGPRDDRTGRGDHQDELLSLHGLMQPTATRRGRVPAVDASPTTRGGSRPVRAAAAGARRHGGRGRADVGGKRFRRGGKVILRPGTDGDPYDRMMDGRTATLERIYLDYDGTAYFGVTVDEDPMREVLRDSGRYLFFFADEVQARMSMHSESPTPPDDLTTVFGRAAVPAAEGSATASSSPGSATPGCRTTPSAARSPNGSRGRAAGRGGGLRLRDRRPRPRLRGHARLQRARPRRRQPPGRRARAPST